MASSSPPPGTSDIFPDQIGQWYILEDAARKVFPLYGYNELRTPVFEYTEIFERGLGGETEVVKKEMYTFEDRGGRSLTLRPEGTAGVMRALSGTDVMNGNEQRVFYIGPMFRGERPAAGRRRQFHQVGVENAGRVAPGLDAECIAMLMHYLEETGIGGAELLINTRGTREDRKPAEDALRKYFSGHKGNLCADCAERLERNVWRILDCKQEQCQELIESAPETASLFSSETRKYFDDTCTILSGMGLDFKIEPRLVRGLDYYVHTVFEVTHPGLGAQNAVAGGGRYELFLPDSRKPVIGTGFAAGLERLLMARESLGVKSQESPRVCVYLAALDDASRAFNMNLASKLRKEGISAIPEAESKSMKAQMRTANKLNVLYSIICGESEMQKGKVTLRCMQSGEQSEIEPEKLAAYIKDNS